jgi:hypothetical protein
VGGVERGIRLALGVLLIALAYGSTFPQWAAVVCYLAGAVAIGTGLGGFCPAWKLLGINTCGTKPA